MSFTNRKQYGQFIAVMHREYERAVKKMREELSQGRTYDHACDTLADIALFLELPYEKVESTKLTLLNDMMLEAEYHLERQNKKTN